MSSTEAMPRIEAKRSRGEYSNNMIRLGEGSRTVVLTLQVESWHILKKNTPKQDQHMVAKFVPKAHVTAKKNSRCPITK